MQARAKALSEDEKNKMDLAKACPYRNIGFPQTQSRVNKFLDIGLLQQHKLLVPSKYLPKPLPHLSNPEGETVQFTVCQWSFPSIYLLYIFTCTVGQHSQYIQETKVSRKYSHKVPEKPFLLPTIQTISPTKVTIVIFHFSSLHSLFV